MKKILEDTMTAITLLSELPGVDKSRIGALGHSMGGNTVQFLSALDERISFACASGSACSYKNRMENGVGIELACVAPRKLLIVSADDDKYSLDAADVAEVAKITYAELNAEDNIVHVRYKGGQKGESICTNCIRRANCGFR